MPDPDDAAGREDAYDLDDGGHVEITVIDGKDAPVAHKSDEKLYVMRDSKDPDGPKLYFTQAEWDAFVGGVKDGEFDLENMPLPDSTD